MDNLASHKQSYENKGITLRVFREKCRKDIADALQTDLAKHHKIRRALISFLNFMVSCTVIVPIASKIMTGHWTLFKNRELESVKHLQQMDKNLQTWTDPENNLTEPGSHLSI